MHVLHAVLRRKARCEAAGERVDAGHHRSDLRDEVERFKQAQQPARGAQPGTYV